ncbi:MAG TPA: hypothetical protein VIH37_07225, partial [Candidatus Limnocylindrales bacterium]
AITLLADNSIYQNYLTPAVKGDLVTAGAGTIDVAATNGSIVMAVSGSGATPTLTKAQTSGGNIRYQAGDSIVLALLDARTSADRTGGTLTQQASWGDIAVKAGTVVTTGSITDAKNASSALVNLDANHLRLSAAANLGTLGASANPLELETIALAAVGATGGIDLLDLTDVTVDTVGPVAVNRVGLDGTTSGQQDNASTSDLVTTGGDGAIVLRTVNGSITLNDGLVQADPTAVSANGAGNVLIEAQGAGRNVNVNAAVKSAAGNLTLKARTTINLNANGDLETGLATIDVEAVDQDIAMTSGVHLQTSGGNIRLNAGRHVVLGLLDTRIGSDRTGGTRTLQSDATTPWGDA